MADAVDFVLETITGLPIQGARTGSESDGGA